MSRGLIWMLYYAICCAIAIQAHPLETDDQVAQVTSFSTQTSTSTSRTSRSSASQTLSRTPGPTTTFNAGQPPTSPDDTGSGAFPTGTRIGAAVGGGLAGLLICTLLVCWVMKKRKNKKRLMLASKTSSKKPMSEKGRASAELKAPASSTAHSEAADGNDRAQERIRSMHKSSTL